MEWLISSTEFKKRDRDSFSFNSSPNFEARAIKIEEQENGRGSFESKNISSVSEYGAWIKNCRPSSTGPHRPTLLLFMHKRLEGNDENGGNGERIPLAYDEEAFKSFCRDLCQHRSLVPIISRLSTAVFSCRPVTWQSPNDFGPSTVYHCKSHTESHIGDDDIVLSTTCFTDVPITFAVMYGCTDRFMEDTTMWLKRCQWSVYHPLVLPMIFAEHERKRLLNAVDKKSTELGERILELEKRVNTDTKKEVKQHTDRGQGRRTMTQRDCEAINLWRSMSSLKNGLESLHTELVSMRDHLMAMPKSADRPRLGQRPEIHIDIRLKEMMAELRSKIRSCDSLLGSMTLATQMEWNYYTRLDAHLNFGIATATRMDSSQMKQISLLGMIFLPGTFLATVFSMTFFRWMPENSTQITSPWLALYAGLTLLLTSGTVLWFNKWAPIEAEAEAKKSVQEDMGKDMETTLFSRLTFRSSVSSDETDDLEKGISHS